MSHISLTAVDVDIEITGSATVTQGSDIVVVGVSITSRVNDLSEASVSLGYKTKAGLKKLRALFPQAGEGAHFGEMKITLRAGGPLSNIKKDFCMFSGTIIGFSHSKAAGAIQFQLNARGGLYQLSQIIVASPGFHPSTPVSWGLTALSTDAKGGEAAAVKTVEGIIGSCVGDNAFDMYKCVIGELLEHWKGGQTGPGGAFQDQVFAAAVKAYGLGPGNVSIIETELDKVHVADGLNQSALFDNIVNTAVIGVTLSAVSNAQHTFWSFLLEVLDEFGLDVVSMGNTTFIVAKAPLVLPVSFNRINATDQAQVVVSDFPFQAPTRCIVTTSNSDVNAHNQPEEVANEVGIYPEDLEPTTQEMKTGIKTLYVPLPGFFAYLPYETNQPFVDEAQTRKHNAATNNPDEAKKAVSEAAAQAAQIAKEFAADKNHSRYAQYSLMKAIAKQRTGSVTLRLKPEVVPGFCARVEDPLGIATFDCLVQEVTHTINYQSAIAETTMSVNYIRYSKEVRPYPFPSPFYPGYNAEGTASKILASLCG